MKEMTKRTMFSMFLVCLLVALTFVSCATGTKNEKEMQVISVEPDVVQEDQAVEDLGESNWLSALGDIHGLDIKSYRLRGEGPDGAKFDWIDVTGTKVALSDIRRGQWTLYAEAIGENGDILATGKLETFLSNSSPMGALVMDPEVGSGSARCSFAWNTFQVLYPTIEIYVKKGDGDYIPRDISEISIGDGVAVWNAKDIGAGSYIVRAVLKDEGEVVAGVAAAMRILDGKQSVGDVRFTVGKLSAIYGISLENTPTTTVRGTLELAENGDVKYVSDEDGLRFDWFLNGEYVTENNSNTLNILQNAEGKGFYRVDCVVQNSNLTSINSASFLVYCDGVSTRLVSVEEAEGIKEDKPSGYEEITTDSELTVERPVIDEAVQKVIDQAIKEEPVVETPVEPEPVVEEVVEEVVEPEPVEDEDPIYYVYGG